MPCSTQRVTYALPRTVTAPCSHARPSTYTRRPASCHPRTTQPFTPQTGPHHDTREPPTSHSSCLYPPYCHACPATKSHLTCTLGDHLATGQRPSTAYTCNGGSNTPIAPIPCPAYMQPRICCQQRPCPVQPSCSQALAHPMLLTLAAMHLSANTSLL